MKIYVVNLEGSLDRRAAMRLQLDPLGLDYEFFPAVDGKAEGLLRFPNHNDEFCLKAWRRPLTSGEAGCFASHYSLWQRCVEEGEPIIVLEDGSGISPRFAEAVDVVAGALRRTAYVRLACIRLPAHRLLEKLSEEWRLVRFSRSPLGTQCYAISPQGAARLLKGAAEWRLPVDNYMDSFWMHGVPGSSLFPLVAWRRKISSDIRDSNPPLNNPVWKPKRIARHLADTTQRVVWNLGMEGALRREVR